MAWRVINRLRQPLAACNRARSATTMMAFTSSAYVAPPPASTLFDSWLVQTAQSVSSPTTVREFLGISTSTNPATLSLQSRSDVVASPDFVRKISAVSQWAFQVHGASSRAGDDQRTDEIERLFEELMPWGNMAQGDVWQHFHIRQFFLSRAPLETFLACYEVHRRALETADQRFLPLPSGLLLRELCWRGRFAEALTAYTRLELNDVERRSFAAVLYEYEQYESLRKVYALQDERDAAHDRETPLLDPLFILHALKELGQRDELMDRFECLPHEDQGRADIQKLLEHA